MNNLISGSSPFDGDPNATTIGKHSSGNSVTIDDDATLQQYLPAGGPSAFLPAIGDTHFSSFNPIPANDIKGGVSNGSGGGTLSGQSMAMGLNLFLSGKTVAGMTYPAGLGGVVIPGSGQPLCTRRATRCQAFAFPVCAQGMTVSALREAANNFLGTGSTGICTAGEFNDALDKINQAFDGCAEIVACPVNVPLGPYDCE